MGCAAPDEGIVAVVAVGRIELERRLADVLAPARFDQAIERVVGVAADRLDLLVVVEDRLQRVVSMRVMLPAGS